MATEKVKEVPKLLKDASQRQYLPSSILGAGGFATCWKARMCDRREAPEASDCALKAIKAQMPSNLRQRFKLELAIHSKLHHPNIVEFYRAFTSQDVTYVALELCPNGSLTDMMKKRKFLTMGEIRRILLQLCGAVKYLHKRDVVHRDIKAGNIFLDKDMNVKLGDFGLAAIMEPGNASTHARRTTFCGTPNYLAPEILDREGGGHGMSVDIWAIGILAYYLAVGRAPFHSKSREEIYERLKKGEYNWPEYDPGQNEIPDDLKDLVAILLVEETQRPTPDQIVRHRFFTRGFIPNELDDLCRVRRPRFARIGDDSDTTDTYERLCRNSHVGIHGRELGKPKKYMLSLCVVLAEEYAAGIKLNIPLKEGIIYTGKRHMHITQAPISIIHEEEASHQRPFHPPQAIFQTSTNAHKPARPVPSASSIAKAAAGQAVLASSSSSSSSSSSTNPSAPTGPKQRQQSQTSTKRNPPIMMAPEADSQPPSKKVFTNLGAMPPPPAPNRSVPATISFLPPILPSNFSLPPLAFKSSAFPTSRSAADVLKQARDEALASTAQPQSTRIVADNPRILCESTGNATKSSTSSSPQPRHARSNSNLKTTSSSAQPASSLAPSKNASVTCFEDVSTKSSRRMEEKAARPNSVVLRQMRVFEALAERERQTSKQQVVASTQQPPPLQQADSSTKHQLQHEEPQQIEPKRRAESTRVRPSRKAATIIPLDEEAGKMTMETRSLRIRPRRTGVTYA